MKDIAKAIEEEKLYIIDKMNDINTSLLSRLQPFGYENLNEYFIEKRNYLFNQWRPEVYPINVKTLTTELENAIRNEKYGIYLSVSDSLYAFHGSDDINYKLCEKLGVYVAELFYKGGTIIGSPLDLGIEIVAPNYIGLDCQFILNKFYNIISKYLNNVEISGNDILIDGKKILGSMERRIGNVYVWAAQISFGNYNSIIEQICNKKSTKIPGFIDHHLLTKDVLEKEILSWLQKQ